MKSVFVFLQNPPEPDSQSSGRYLVWFQIDIKLCFCFTNHLLKAHFFIFLLGLAEKLVQYKSAVVPPSAMLTGNYVSWFLVLRRPGDHATDSSVFLSFIILYFLINIRKHSNIYQKVFRKRPG